MCYDLYRNMSIVSILSKNLIELKIWYVLRSLLLNMSKHTHRYPQRGGEQKTLTWLVKLTKHQIHKPLIVILYRDIKDFSIYASTSFNKDATLLLRKQKLSLPPTTSIWVHSHRLLFKVLTISPFHMNWLISRMSLYICHCLTPWHVLIIWCHFSARTSNHLHQMAHT